MNREGRLCVQIGVLGSPREPFTSFQMIGLAAILGWLDSWQIPRRWPAGQPAPFRQLTRPRSRALWARGGHYGASQVPECDNLGPGGIDIDQLTRLEVGIARELTEPGSDQRNPHPPGRPPHPRDPGPASGSRLTADEQMEALRVITEHLAPGQWSYARCGRASPPQSTSGSEAEAMSAGARTWFVRPKRFLLAGQRGRGHTL